MTLETYSHVAGTLQREAADVLDRLLGEWEPDTPNRIAAEREKG
jgi:hypothetical protein